MGDSQVNRRRGCPCQKCRIIHLNFTGSPSCSRMGVYVCTREPRSSSEVHIGTMCGHGRVPDACCMNHSERGVEKAGAGVPASTVLSPRILFRLGAHPLGEQGAQLREYAVHAVALVPAHACACVSAHRVRARGSAVGGASGGRVQVLYGKVCVQRMGHVLVQQSFELAALVFALGGEHRSG